MTVFSGPFMAATVTEGAVLSINSRTTNSSAHIEAMAPPPGTRCIKVPRATTSRTASSSDMTSAAQAAAISPMLCPMTALGVMPQDFNSSASAYSTANNAGCVKSVRLTSASSLRSAKMTSSKPLSRWGVANSWQRSIALRKIAFVRYSSAPIPACCGPWPEYMKATGPLLVRFRFDESRPVVCSQAARCFFSSATERAGAAKRNANWLLLTLVVKQTSPIGASGLSSSQFRKLLHPPHQCLSGFGRKGEQAARMVR